MELSLNDRVDIVAEGASGLGWAAAEWLVAEDARVVLTGGSEDALDAAVTVLGQSAAVSVVTDGIDGRVSDVTDEEWTSAFESVFS